MDTQAIKIIKTEVVLEETKSTNHSRLIHRLGVALLPTTRTIQSVSAQAAGAGARYGRATRPG